MGSQAQLGNYNEREELTCMGNLPSPIDLVKFWWSKNKDAHNRLSEYLDSIANEAKSLANVWNQIGKRFENILPIQEHDAAAVGISLLSEIGIITIPNPGFYSIVIHYERLSTVIGGKVSEEIQFNLMNCLSRIIIIRQTIMGLLVEACKILQDDKNIRVDMLDQVKEALYALNNEVASLDFLAKAFKVKK